MPLEQTIGGVIERTITDALADRRFRDLRAGRMPRQALHTFARHFIITHLNSVQVLSFLHALAPPDASELVRENLLEEMGMEEGEQAHLDLLMDLARGLDFDEPQIARLIAEAQEARRQFASVTLSYPTLRELGLSILLETLTFEAFLSRASDGLAEALARDYGLSPEAVRWFTLHGEVDIRHAEEGKRVVERFIAFHRFGQAEVEEILRKTFARNVLLDRYFPGGATSMRAAGRSRVESIDILPLRIPFRSSFDHSRASRASSDAVMVRVNGRDGTRGYGEALPRPYVTGEDVKGMVATLSSSVAPLVLTRTFSPGPDIIEEVRALAAVWTRSQPATVQVAAWNATWCAMELALLDWAFGLAGRSISEWLVPVRQEVVYTGVVEASGPQAAAALAERYAEAGFAQVKVKVGVGNNARRLAAVRRAVGDAVRVRVDANGAWSPAQAVTALKGLRAFGVEAVEQPVPAGDFEGMRRVREETGLPVVADESLLTLEDAQRLIQARACDVFNIRVSKCGGLVAARAIAAAGHAAGLKLQVGAQVGETSLLSAAGRHLAAYLPEADYVEGSFGMHLLTEDITPQPVMFGYKGEAGLLPGDGLGVLVDDEALERLAVDTVHVKA